MIVAPEAPEAVDAGSRSSDCNHGHAGADVTGNFRAAKTCGYVDNCYRSYPHTHRLNKR